jgi:hypothetical protein
MEKNYIIRKATKEDISTILEMGVGIVDKYERTHLGDEMVNGYIGSGACKADFIKHIDNTQLLLLDNKVIGLIIWIEDRIQGFLIDIPNWGAGAAQYLINSTLAVKFQEYEEVKLECFKSSPRANAFYKKMGWKETEIIESDGMTMVVYKKSRQ